jgi:hypothetical protein
VTTEPSKEEVTWLLALDVDQIDFTSLTESVLTRLALESELYIATMAIGELASRGSSDTAGTALAILQGDTADGWLKAAALSALSCSKPEAANKYIVENSASAEVPVFFAMLEAAIDQSMNEDVVITGGAHSDEDRLSAIAALHKRLHASEGDVQQTPISREFMEVFPEDSRGNSAE